jgi:DnaJ-class molecular chaperone
MNSIHDDSTGVFKRAVCQDCHGSGELRIDSENINENFEVEKQTVIAECPSCAGVGSVPLAG